MTLQIYLNVFYFERIWQSQSIYLSLEFQKLRLGFVIIRKYRVFFLSQKIGREDCKNKKLKLANLKLLGNFILLALLT